MDRNKDNLSDLTKKNKEDSGFQLALRYLSYRPRTSYEIENHLKRKGYEGPIISKIMDRLTYYKYVDDVEYTKNYISASIRARKKSSKIIELELERRGVPPQIIDRHIVAFTDEINLEIAEEISSKYFYQNSNLPFNQLKNRLSQLLVRRGFSWELINYCISSLEDNTGVQAILKSQEDTYRLQALELGGKYLNRYRKKEKNPYILKQKIRQALYRRGYSRDTIDSVIDHILDRNGDFNL